MSQDWAVKAFLLDFLPNDFSGPSPAGCSGKSEYIEPAKRAHIMALPRGRGRGAFGPQCRPHDIFRQRKQNTSRPPSMHVDDFVAAEFKDIGLPVGPLQVKRVPKGSPKVPTRGLFTGTRGGGRGGPFHSQTRFFTPPAPKGVLLSGALLTHTWRHEHTADSRVRRHLPLCAHVPS